MSKTRSSSRGQAKKKKVILSLLAASVLIVGAYFFTDRKAPSPEQATLGGKEIIVYKTPTCGCCGVYVSYLKQKGAIVRMENLANLDDIKSRYGVPANLLSCHTSVVDGYVVEGHIPLEAIEKLMSERPEVKGIGLPGMPSGTPGMPGPKTEQWDIRSFTDEGTTATFARI